MISSPDQIRKKILIGEDSGFELKEVKFDSERIRAPSQDDIADVLAAFANGSGGALLLGVQDSSRTITGIPLQLLDEAERMVRQACCDSIKPTLNASIRKTALDDENGDERYLLWVDVPASLTIHKSPGGYMQRQGAMTRSMETEALQRLIMHRSHARLIRYDETPVMAASITDLDEQLWQRFAGDHSQDELPIMLSKLAMAAVDEQGVWHPTVAGLLMACPNPHQYIPTAYIQAVAYRGTEPASGNYQLDAKDIYGPLDEQIAAACKFVHSNMKIAGYKHPNGGREDTPQYDMIAVFEAVVNAVVHRDYSAPGSRIRLHMFSDRLELYSPGRLPNTVSVENLMFRQ
ncbi:MAG: putative DNA binding domain-containing protein, partial [Betaproteobacteria bacterium]|nr:putative DNA binding domain-containing protein [Betaproteobacteria bacterium]